VGDVYLEANLLTELGDFVFSDELGRERVAFPNVELVVAGMNWRKQAYEIYRKNCGNGVNEKWKDLNEYK
jgi:hypothetical protein